MGCVSSKECNPPGAGWCFHLPSLKARTSPSNRQHAHHHDADADIESRHVVSLTSSSYGLLNTEISPSQGSFLSFHGQSRKFQAMAAYNDIVFSQGLDARHLAACALMQPFKNVSEEDALLSTLTTNNPSAMETIDTWELMDGLEDGGCNTQFSSTGYEFGKLKMSRKPRSLDFTTIVVTNGLNASRELLCGPHASDALVSDSGSPIWKKYYPHSEMEEESSYLCQRNSPQRSPSSPSEGSSRGTMPCAHFSDSTRKQPSCSSLVELEDLKSASSGDLLDKSSSGLKLLLSPVSSWSYYASKKARFRATSLSFDSNTLYLRVKSADQCGGSPGARKRWSRQESMESSRSSDTQLFDPALMATFEQALEVTSQSPQDDWSLQQSMDENTTNSSSSDNTWSMSEMASDAESGPQWRQPDKAICGMSAMVSLEEEDKDIAVPLTRYELKCPPQGNNKVVLYYTSLRGVRKTYEDCCSVRLILKGLGVHVEERDVWMHSQYKEELRDVLGDLLKGVALVPQLFIKGRYIGGAEEVKKLHEDAKLARLVDGIAMDVVHRVCDGCGDVRFVPCLNCNGSCKVRNHHEEVLRCPVCNENGLIMCPICTI